MIEHPHILSSVVVICNSEDNRNSPVVFASVVTTIIPLGNAKGTRCLLVL